YPPSNRPARRSVHAKMQACVRAKFDVEPDLEPELRHGLFGAPRSYPAWIRFSNGSGKIEPDTQNDAHGMAIKVLEVDGPKILPGEEAERTQDFVLIDHPVFFIQNPADFARFTEVAGDHPHSPLAGLLAFAVSSFSHAREAFIAS